LSANITAIIAKAVPPATIFNLYETEILPTGARGLPFFLKISETQKQFFRI
jgi:hypothetical protein